MLRLDEASVVVNLFGIPGDDVARYDPLSSRPGANYTLTIQEKKYEHCFRPKSVSHNRTARIRS